MNEVFESALGFTLANEGSKFTNDPNDSGGPTKWGVTLKAWQDFIEIPVTPFDIENLTLYQVQPFYLMQYWEPLCCAKIKDPGIAIALFDTGVLYGTTIAAILAQRAINACGYYPDIDGIIGPNTLLCFSWVQRYDFLKHFNVAIIQRIDAVIQKDAKNERFRKGWTARANRLLTLNTKTVFNISF